MDSPQTRWEDEKAARRTTPEKQAREALIDRLENALKAVEYVPCDHPIVPEVYATFVKEASSIVTALRQHDERALGGGVYVPAEFLEFVKNAPVSSGVCCCGDDMDKHPDPMSCGHTPTDQWHHSLSLWIDQLDTLRQHDEAGAQSGGVKVKPLEWGPYPNPVFAGPDIAVASSSVFGEHIYQVQRDPRGPGYIAFCAPKFGTSFWEVKGFDTIEEAKAAAKADYERRILSTLSPQPEGEAR